MITSLFSKQKAIIILSIFWVGQLSAQSIFTDIAAQNNTQDFGAGFASAWGDYNNDGFLDLYISNTDGANLFYVNNGNSGFTELADSLGIDAESKFTYMGLWGDFDNDDDLDLYLANNGLNTLYENDNGIFKDVTNVTGLTDAINSYCAVWGDYDLDGDLDLFVGNFGGEDRLFRNDNHYFVNVASEAGVDNYGFTRAALWTDLDNDGDLDLYVARGSTGDAQTDLLYINENGVFTNIATNVGITEVDLSLGVDAGDFDNDGDLDIYVSTHTGFPNKLYLNNNGTFQNIAANSAVDDYSACYASTWVDFDNDADLDIFIVRTPDLGPILYQNDNDFFTQVQNQAGFNSVTNSTGMSWGDYDNDGDLDVYLPNRQGANFFYENAGNSNNWLNVKCKGTSFENRFGIGAKIRLVAGNTVQTREVRAGTGESTQHSIDEEFGLGNTTLIDTLTVFWHVADTSVTLTNVAANQFLVINEPEVPLISKIYPDSGYQGYPLEISIFGKNTHFNEGSGINRIWLEKDTSEIEAMNFTVINNTELQALFSPPAAADTGLWNLFIASNIDGTISYRESIRILEPPAIVEINIDSVTTTLDIGDSIDINITITNNAAINGDTLTWQAEITTLASEITRQSTSPNSAIFNNKDNAQTSMFAASIATSNHKTINETAGLIKTETGNIAYGIELLNLNAFVKFGLNNPESLNEITPVSASYYAGDFDDKGNFYAINNAFQTLVHFDTLTGAETIVGPMEALPGHSWTGLSYNFTDGSFYATSSSGTSSALYSVDHFTGNVVLIGETSAAPVIIDIAVDNNGVLFAHEIITDAIYTVDKLTGEVNFVGYTGFDANYAQGMDCDPMNNELYLAAFNNNSSTAELRKVNKSNGQTTFIGFIGDGYFNEICAFGISGNSLPFAKIISEKAGQIAPGDIGGFTLRLYALDIPDTTYYANIKVITNDPFSPTIEIPIRIKSKKSVNITPRNSIPVKFQINQNYPNPFNPSTSIEYAIPYPNHVRVAIYNVLGQMVNKLVDEPQQSSKYKIVWNGRNDTGNPVASGIYILKFEAGEFQRTYKLILTK